MGAWGVKPFASDEALDWLGSRVTDPMAKEIQETLERFLGYTKKERSVHLMDGSARVTIYKPKKPRFTRAAVADLRKSRREVKMVGRPSSHGQVEAAAALLDESTSYGSRWRLFNYVKWGEDLKKAQKKQGPRGRLYYSNQGLRRSTQPVWNKGKPPTALPADHRLIFESSKDKIRLRLDYRAEHTELYSLAARAIREVMDDDAYLSSWRNGSEKRAALRPLLESLERKALTEVHATEKKIAESLSFRRLMKARRKKRTQKARKPQGRKKAS